MWPGCGGGRVMIVVVVGAGGDGATRGNTGTRDSARTPVPKGNLDGESSYRRPARAGDVLDGGAEALDWGGSTCRGGNSRRRRQGI